MTEPGMIRRLYDWVLHWGFTPYAIPALFILAFTESSFFPIPPDVLLIALTMGIPSKAMRFAMVCTIGSVIGGVFGYLIGMFFFDYIGLKILEFYGFLDKYAMIRDLYMKYDVWIVGAAGFTPIPYKVFTIAAGVFDMDIFRFIVASAVSRGARFFLVAGLIWKFGRPIKIFIDKYFNILSIIFFILLVLGFVVIKFLL